MRRKFVAGNWKMNKLSADAVELARSVAQAAANAPRVDVAVFPPFPYLAAVKSAIGDGPVAVGAQNCYRVGPGAFTGEVAAEMLLDVGCRWVILGHSERRHILGETNPLVNQKVKHALSKGLPVILCVGEQLDERKAGKTETVLEEQMTGSLEGIDAAAMASVVIAYEPVWAIGTGVNATPEEAEAALVYLRGWLSKRYNPDVAAATRILYGGSVNRDKVSALLAQPNLDGVLVGGASLIAGDFAAIIAFTQAAS